jgi:magnesium chelatase family protein
VASCPCGYAGDGTRRCRSGSVAIARYRARLSGPLLDRLDLHVRVKSTEVATLLEARPVADSSTLVRLRVGHARALQLDRQGVLNSVLPPAELERHASPDRETRDLLQFAAERFNLSARACGRILRVARTIADLDSADAINVHHVSEALLFRQSTGRGSMRTWAQPQGFARRKHVPARACTSTSCVHPATDVPRYKVSRKIHTPR